MVLLGQFLARRPTAVSKHIYRLSKVFVLGILYECSPDTLQITLSRAAFESLYVEKKTAHKNVTLFRKFLLHQSGPVPIARSSA